MPELNVHKKSITKNIYYYLHRAHTEIFTYIYFPITEYIQS